LQNDTTLYQVKFKNFSGDLEAYIYDAVLKDFSSSPAWSAAAMLDNLASPQTSRAIITRNDSQGVAFDWANLSAAQKADLLIEPNGSTGTTTKGQARVNYIRGDKSNELGAGGVNFRKRDSLLGDIINSSPVSVGKPKATWPNAAPFPTAAGQTYSDFSLAQASRPEMAYVGANDGMLHGFKGADGSEAIAYIPKAVFSAAKSSGLHYLTDTNYSHRYYVDMPSVVEDAYFDTGSGAAWHSVLVGGTRSGGKGIFALDVTNPAVFSEANAASIALWEFNSSDDADMGYSFSTPTIAMLNNNRWAAIFGNGYNNNGDGKAKLFILFLDGGLDGVWTAGSDYIELSTNAGSIVASKNCADPLSDCNGLSTPQKVDTNNDQVVDRVYAGDLKGNLWAFDLSSTNPVSWGVAYSGSPLFVANQPITSKPAVISHPTELTGTAPNLMVFFGTGQYLTTADINSVATQGFYGVWDNGSASLTSANLVEQRFFTFTDKAGNTIDAQSALRVLSDNPVDYSVKHGWFIQFKNGERITTDPLIYEEVVLFNTRIPSITACTSGGNGSKMFVPQATGGRASFNIFDANKDKVVSAADYLQDASDVNYAVSSVAVVGKFPEQSSLIGNLLATPYTDTAKDYDILYVPNQGSMKRLSWQELQKE
jgi:type IV pilus assembly protein PilY1